MAQKPKEPSVKLELRNGDKVPAALKLLFPLLLLPGGYSIRLWVEKDEARWPPWLSQQVEGYKSLAPDGYQVVRVWAGPGGELVVTYHPER